MSLKVAIFEDDTDVAELLVEIMEVKDFTAKTFYSLQDDSSWINSDIILGDYRNCIVSFNELKSECLKHNLPLIAISGAETDYSPQLLKPFSIENLQELIDETLKKKAN
ncbi:MAG: hypothetical protein KDD45_05395 [Bdellovibrionales bacterium]|nr:hypothetical protein [Bdellovibrionales bacterium]